MLLINPNDQDSIVKIILRFSMTSEFYLNEIQKIESRSLTSYESSAELEHYFQKMTNDLTPAVHGMMDGAIQSIFKSRT